MKEHKRYLTEARVGGECLNTPDAVKFDIDEGTAKEILRLRDLVIANGLHKVEKFDARASFLLHHPEKDPESAQEAGEDNAIRTECDVLVVSDDEFWFAAYVKHTDVTAMSERQSIADLLEHFGIGAEGANPPPVNVLKTNNREVFPGATAAEIAEVLMADIIGDYDTQTVPEWVWVQKVASFAHVGNGREPGVWEFVLNLGNALDETAIPEKLVPVIQQARQHGLSYLIFHQG